MNTLTVVGAGLAGCEAALQAAGRGVRVRLVEMRPGRQTEAHRTGDVAELVCSNSLKSDEPRNGHGLLKAELRILGCTLLECAEQARVPGGKALVVDRERFSRAVQAELDRAGVELAREEQDALPDGPAVIASGPLTSEPLVRALEETLGTGRLWFFDAIAPIVSADSLDTEVVFAGSRYGAGEGTDYLNCPMDRDEYERFVRELVEAGTVAVRDFETKALFEGCLPVEELARRGPDTLAFGPMKPVGLRPPPGRGHDPGSADRSGSCPRLHAVVQLRRENAEGTMLNLVGFQTRLKQGEQRRVFRMIPGLGKAEFLRYGSMHRNTYLDGPRVLLPTLQTRERQDLFVAGQLTGVEGYVESIGAGLVAGINAARMLRGEEPVEVPVETMLGSLLRYVAGCGHNDVGNRTSPQNGDTIRDPEDRMPVMSPTRGACSSFRLAKDADGGDSRHVIGPFQPMNANFGLLPVAEGAKGKHDRRQKKAERALEIARSFAAVAGLKSQA